MENSSRDGNIRPPYLPPEKPVCGSSSNITGHETTDYFKFGKGVHQGCILSPCVFNLNREYIMQNARRNLNNLRYTNDTTLMAGSKEELKSLLMRVKEESEKVGLKLNSQKSKITASSLITSWQIEREKVEALTDFIFLCFNPKECSNYHTTAFISHASKVMLKIIQARLQQYVNRELPDV